MSNTDKENNIPERMTGTCSHRISEGVASWVKQNGQLVYGTFCGDCAYFFHKQGRLVNKELSDLISNSENLSNDSLKAELEKASELIKESKYLIDRYSSDTPLDGVVDCCNNYNLKANEFLKIKEGE